MSDNKKGLTNIERVQSLAKLLCDGNLMRMARDTFVAPETLMRSLLMLACHNTDCADLRGQPQCPDTCAIHLALNSLSYGVLASIMSLAHNDRTIADLLETHGERWLEQTVKELQAEEHERMHALAAKLRQAMETGEMPADLSAVAAPTEGVAVCAIGPDGQQVEFTPTENAELTALLERVRQRITGQGGPALHVEVDEAEAGADETRFRVVRSEEEAGHDDGPTDPATD